MNVTFVDKSHRLTNTLMLGVCICLSSYVEIKLFILKCNLFMYGNITDKLFIEGFVVMVSGRSWFP